MSSTTSPSAAPQYSHSRITTSTAAPIIGPRHQLAGHGSRPPTAWLCTTKRTPKCAPPHRREPALEHERPRGVAEPAVARRHDRARHADREGAAAAPPGHRERRARDERRVVAAEARGRREHALVAVAVRDELRERARDARARGSRLEF